MQLIVTAVGEAEILSIRFDADKKYRFYVHYLDCNRRLDEWVDETALDLNTVRFPQKGSKLQKSQLDTASRYILKLSLLYVFSLQCC